MIDPRWFDPYPPGTNANCLRFWLPDNHYVDIIDIHHARHKTKEKPYYLYSDFPGIKSRHLSEKERWRVLAYPDTMLMEALL